MKHYTGITGADPAKVADKLAAQLVTDIREALAERDEARVVFSTGATPVQTYAVLRARYRSALPWNRVCIQQLDEYSGLLASDPRRFDAFLKAQLVAPLGTRFRGWTGEETDAELAAFDARLAAEGGLHLVLFGVGVNGHLGFNEPGSPIDSASRRVDLHAATVARIDTQHGAAPSKAVTLGLAPLTAAKRVRVVALGAAKRHALARGLLQPPGLDSPLSMLQVHPDVRYFIDVDAAPDGSVLAPPP